MNKIFLSWIMLVVFAISMISPISLAQDNRQGNEQNKSTVTIIDAFGDEVEVPYPVERIVVLNPMALIHIAALGGADKIVGTEHDAKWVAQVVSGIGETDTMKENFNVTKNSGLLERMDDMPTFGMFMPPAPPDYQGIIDLKPDVVITMAPMMAEMVGYYPHLKEMLEPEGIKVIALNFYDAKTFDRDIESLGKILGKEEEAEDYANFARAYTDKIWERVKDIPEEERVTVMYDTPAVGGIFPGLISGEGLIGDQVIEMAGGRNVLEREGGIVIREGMTDTYASMVTPGWIREQNPDVIISEPKIEMILGLGNFADYTRMMIHYMRTGDLYDSVSPIAVKYLERPTLYTVHDDLVNNSPYKEVNAIQNDKVNVTLMLELIYPPAAVGFAAKWFYPDRFEDMDPNDFLEAWLERYFGITYAGEGEVGKLVVYPYNYKTDNTVPGWGYGEISGGGSGIGGGRGEGIGMGKGESKEGIVEIKEVSEPIEKTAMEKTETKPEEVIAGHPMEPVTEKSAEGGGGGIPLIVFVIFAVFAIMVAVGYLLERRYEKKR